MDPYDKIVKILYLKTVIPVLGIKLCLFKRAVTVLIYQSSAVKFPKVEADKRRPLRSILL
jgi:hypothetical protein